MTKRSITVIDSHVHFYDIFQLDRLFDSVWQQAEQVARQQFADVFFVGLCVADMKAQNWLAQFQGNDQQSDQLKRWHIELDANNSLMATAKGPGEEQINLLFGQQIVTSEGLEVLLYNHPERVADGEPIRQIIQKAAPDSVCILPWGVGKWLGKRGTVINQLLEEFKPGDFLLGDNSGRPTMWNPIQHFELARAKGFKVISGSDPLGIAEEEDRAGTYAEFYIQPIDQQNPAKSMVDLLKNEDGQAFGQLETLKRFVTNQIKIRL